MDLFCRAAHSHTTTSYVSVAHQLPATATAASKRVNMNLKAPSTPAGDKTTLFVCGALHPAMKAFRTRSFSLLPLLCPSHYITLKYISPFDTGHQRDDMDGCHSLSANPCNREPYVKKTKACMLMSEGCSRNVSFSVLPHSSVLLSKEQFCI